MRYVSEMFKEKQDEIIRPALKMRFELGTDINNPVGSAGDTYLDFDDTVAPIVKPTSCSNNYYYAVLGDNKGVDDPDRICSPDNSGAIATPTHSVPYGITTKKNSGSEALIGNSAYFFYNFTNITSPITLSFKGGVIPEEIRVEKYSNGSWATEETIINTDLSEEVTFTPSDYSNPNNTYRRFYVKNTQTSGRFQLNWVKADKSALEYFDGKPLVFENNYISSVSISKETDLTSQALPSYQMTITCLDPDSLYTPESDYWDNQFKDGTPCYIKAGFDVGGIVEYVPLFFGNLTEKPKYEQGRITFKIAVDWRKEWSTSLGTTLGTNVSEGSEILSNTFNNLIYNNKIFDSYDVFTDATDASNSIYNYYGELDSEQVRQYIANALGCYMICDFDDYVIRKSTDIQYEAPEDTIERYDQIKCSLESQPKVGRISISRNKNTVGSDYVDVETPTRQTVGSHNPKVFAFEVPFYANGKITIVDAQASPSATVSIYTNPEVIKKDNGMYEIQIPLQANVTSSIKPIVRFFRVSTDVLEETETIDESAGEVYTNNNTLITNSYVANKAKNAARFISGLSNQYEVDVVQDFSRELGDVIRLETQKNVVKTCVITGLQFTLPGSKGHLTCKKIFALADSKYAVVQPEGLEFTIYGTLRTVVSSEGDAVVIGRLKTNNYIHCYVLGVKRYESNGTVYAPNATMKDLNGHVWHIVHQLDTVNGALVTNAPVLEIPPYDSTKGATENSWGAIEMIKALYEEQGMIAPVDYTCTIS